MPDLSPEERLAWLQLARCEGVGPIGFATLLERHGSAKGVLAALRQRAGADGRPLRFPAQDALAAELAALKGLGGRMLAQPEEDYPALLRVLPDAPPVLAVRGDAGLLRRPAVAIVGARNASGNGRLLARALARELAEAGFVVVSGLARGIDTAAHEGALQAGGATVAVIAAGVDVAYPPENEALMARIAAEAAVVSERPLGAQARAKDFPRRNRVIAGLTLGIVVVEAAPQSGSLITARLAADYGREVMAVPGSPLDPRHKGTNQLLREGAHLVESAADVLAALQPLANREPPMPRRQHRARHSAAAERPKTAPEHSRATPPEAPDSLAARLAQALGAEPLAVDELIRECDAPAPDVQAALLELELLGRIDRHPGNRVSLRAG